MWNSLTSRSTWSAVKPEKQNIPTYSIVQQWVNKNLCPTSQTFCCETTLKNFSHETSIYWSKTDIHKHPTWLVMCSQLRGEANFSRLSRRVDRICWIRFAMTLYYSVRLSIKAHISPYSKWKRKKNGPKQTYESFHYLHLFDPKRLGLWITQDCRD